MISFYTNGHDIIVLSKPSSKKQKASIKKSDNNEKVVNRLKHDYFLKLILLFGS